MTFPTNSIVSIGGQEGRVISTESGKRGRRLVTVQMRDGRTVKTDSRMIAGAIQFAAPDPDWHRGLRSSADIVRSKRNGW